MATEHSSDAYMWDSILHLGLGGSFMGVDAVPPTAEAIRAAGADAAIYGIPFDGTVVGRSGANYGPRGIRETSVQFSPFQATFNFNLFDHIKLVDSGDCHVALGNARRTVEIAEHDISGIVEGGAIPVVFGGDHVISLPAIAAVHKKYPNMGLIHIDAHLDTANDVGGETVSSCTPVLRALERGVDPAKTILVGISGWMNPSSELQVCIDRGVAVIWLEDIWEYGVEWAIREIARIVKGSEGNYLTVDIDVLDSAFAPGVCVPTPGGMSTRELIQIVRGAARTGLVGIDVAETAPSLDQSSRTQLITTRVALEALAFNAGCDERTFRTSTRLQYS